MAHEILGFCDILAVYNDAAGVDRDAAAYDVQHGSLAGAVAAYDGNELAVSYFKVKVSVKHLLVYSAGVVCFIYVI